MQTDSAIRIDLLEILGLYSLIMLPKALLTLQFSSKRNGKFFWGASLGQRALVTEINESMNGFKHLNKFNI